MGIATIIGLLLGFGSLLLGFFLENGSPSMLVQLSPIIIIFGGTFGATFISYGMSDIAKIPKLLGKAFSNPKMSLTETMDTIVDLSVKAKREGILVLESVVRDEAFIKKNDPLLVKGLNLLLNRLDTAVLREILENDLHVHEQIEKRQISMFEAMGGYSPTMGVIGTVMGLIVVLANMGEDSIELVHGISAAFIATLYGVFFANILYLPIANKLTLRLKQEMLGKELIIDGVLAINEFENPMAIKERLLPYLKYAGGKDAKAAANSSREVSG
ncbi:MAG TPA: MotA/TolQ/ExbB proton channel family protein [Clostridia bacterium]|nr:MotA/TolQ/ExbB proton channel family protein [Clostridia bacterium]